MLTHQDGAYHLPPNRKYPDVYVLLRKAEGVLVYSKHSQLSSIKELDNKRCNGTVSSPSGTIHNTGLTVTADSVTILIYSLLGAKTVSSFNILVFL